MKKIGIMTMHKIHNYGSFLQAYGLKKIITENFNFKVEFVDYVYEKSLIKTKYNFFEKIKNNLNIFKSIKKRNFRIIFSNEYRDMLLKEGIKDENYHPNIDFLIIGSDEVFNCVQNFPVGYSRELFGKNYENIPVISYAASFGHTTYKDLCYYGIDNEIKELLKKFKSISVRDQNSYNIIYKLTNIKPIINFDPVLVAEFDYKQIVNKIKDDYIILYGYTNRFTTREKRVIKKFAKQINKKIVSIGFYQDIADYNIVCHPLEVFEYFKNAKFVITDTFHGTIFSIKTNQNFCTIIRDSNKNKLYDLLKNLNQTSRIVENIKDIFKLYENIPDYTITNKIIKQEKKKTIEYLSKNLI